MNDSLLPESLLPHIQRGVMSWSYRGRPTWKCPFDLPLYMDVIWEIRPTTVIEFGSSRGGSALWLADTLTAYGLTGSRVLSYDIQPVNDLDDPRIEFAYCDVADPARHLDPHALEGMPHPILVIDDASHMAPDVLAVLRFMDRFLAPGDYVIVEDAIITEMGWSDRYEGGPRAAIETFLAESRDRFEIDRRRCDFYGKNVTWNVNGYLRRV